MRGSVLWGRHPQQTTTGLIFLKWWKDRLSRERGFTEKLMVGEAAEASLLSSIFTIVNTCWTKCRPPPRLDLLGAIGFAELVSVTFYMFAFEMSLCVSSCHSFVAMYVPLLPERTPLFQRSFKYFSSNRANTLAKHGKNWTRTAALDFKLRLIRTKNVTKSN